MRTEQLRIGAMLGTMDEEGITTANRDEGYDDDGDYTQGAYTMHMWEKEG